MRLTNEELFRFIFIGILRPILTPDRNQCLVSELGEAKHAVVYAERTLQMSRVAQWEELARELICHVTTNVSNYTFDPSPSRVIGKTYQTMHTLYLNRKVGWRICVLSSFIIVI